MPSHSPKLENTHESIAMSTQVQKGPAKKATKFQDISELRSALRSQIPEVLTEGQYIWFVTLSVSNNF